MERNGAKPAQPGERRRWFGPEGRIGRRLRTGPGWRAAAAAVLVAALAVWLIRVVAQAIPSHPWATARVFAGDLVAVALVAVLVAVVGLVAAVLIRRRLPVAFLAAWAGSAVLVATMGAGPALLAWLWICTIVLVAAPVVGGWVGSRVAARSGEKGRGRPGTRRTIAAAVAMALIVTTIGWLLSPGRAADATAVDRAETPTFDPGPGPLAVHTVTYGSGSSTYPRYGTDVDVRTDTIDASAQLPEWGPDSLRTDVWGFDATNLPINGTVWAPDEPGSYPLVVILHGNAQHADSELGYDYLAERLASRGSVVASIDESFLNTGLLDRAGGLPGADRLRPWLILQHLAQWSAWAKSGDGPVPNTRLDSVTLIGHSRGGEAAAAAAALASGQLDLDLPPVDLPDVRVTNVVALAPSDGLIVTDEPLRLDGINYLTIAGTHDADISTFAGTRQYERVDPGPDGIASAVLLERANHTRFNTRWGRYDSGAGVSSRVLNVGTLLDPQQQQNATAALVAAFLAAVPGGDPEARSLFTGPIPDADWLPPTDVRVATTIGPRDNVETFDDRNTGPWDEADPTGIGTLSVQGAQADVVALPARTGTTDNRVLHLHDADGTVAVTLTPTELERGSTLTVEIADAAEVGVRKESITLTVIARDADGTETHCAAPESVRPTLNGQLGKWGLLMPFPAGEPFLQSIRVPADCLGDPASQPVIELENVGTEGLYLDTVGFGE